MTIEIDYAVELVENASSNGIVLRIMGGAGIYIHSIDWEHSLSIYKAGGRFTGEGILFPDIDLVAYSSQRKELIKFLEDEIGLYTDPMFKALFSHKRLIYFSKEPKVKLDIFFDKLEFSHDIQLGSAPGKGRLELDFPTLTPADLALSKLQIHDINRKDLIDLAVLIGSHSTCQDNGEKDCIETTRISQLVSHDWGLWYDAKLNLQRTKDLVESLANVGLIDQIVLRNVLEKIRSIKEIVEMSPKSKEWSKRAKIGTAKPWYREVEEVER